MSASPPSPPPYRLRDTANRSRRATADAAAGPSRPRSAARARAPASSASHSRAASAGLSLRIPAPAVSSAGGLLSPFAGWSDLSAPSSLSPSTAALSAVAPAFTLPFSADALASALGGPSRAPSRAASRSPSPALSVRSVPVSSDSRPSVVFPLAASAPVTPPRSHPSPGPPPDSSSASSPALRHTSPVPDEPLSPAPCAPASVSLPPTSVRVPPSAVPLPPSPRSSSRLPARSRSSSSASSASFSSDSSSHDMSSLTKDVFFPAVGSIAEVYQLGPKGFPIAGAGGLNVPLLHAMFSRAESHTFVHDKRITSDRDKVQAALDSFSVNFQLRALKDSMGDFLIDLPWSTFVSTIHNNVLEHQWDKVHRLAIVHAKQGNRPYKEWFQGLEHHNRMLAFSDLGSFSPDRFLESVTLGTSDSILATIEYHGLTKHPYVPVDLPIAESRYKLFLQTRAAGHAARTLAATTAGTSPPPPLATGVIPSPPWLVCAMVGDIAARKEKKRAERLDLYSRISSAKPRSSKGSAAAASSSDTAPSSSGSGATRLHPRKLTEEGRQLLMANNGCLKCRQIFFVSGHNFQGCTSRPAADHPTIDLAYVRRVHAALLVTNPDLPAVRIPAGGLPAVGATTASIEFELAEETAAFLDAEEAAYESAYLGQDSDPDSDFEAAMTIDEYVLPRVSHPPALDLDSLCVSRRFRDAQVSGLLSDAIVCAAVASGVGFRRAVSHRADSSLSSPLTSRPLLAPLLAHARSRHSATSGRVPLNCLIDTGSQVAAIMRPSAAHSLGIPEQEWGVFDVPLVAKGAFADSCTSTTPPGAPVPSSPPSVTSFLAVNRLVCDASERAVYDKDTGYDLLNPSVPRLPPRPAPVDLSAAPVDPLAALRSHAAERAARDADFLALDIASADLLSQFLHGHDAPAGPPPVFSLADFIPEIDARINTIAYVDHLAALDARYKEQYASVFASVPHASHLPTSVLHKIELKDANATIARRAYRTPKQYASAFQALLADNLAAGRIRPSQSRFVSPSFLVDKPDGSKRLVIDYRQLNENTVPDHFPMPLVDDILSDCALGSIWGKLDMTAAFHQTRMHPDSAQYTAFEACGRVWEWDVMPMGGRNAPAVQQRRLTEALGPLIGEICHVYLDDIIIWSNSLVEHQENVARVLAALANNGLYCSLKKSILFAESVTFLGHCISEAGIEADSSKCDRILDWPVPRSAKDVRSFLGLVRYLAAFLPNLAEYTRILTPLTIKAADRTWPGWHAHHQRAFDAIKELVTSRDCLTSINHRDMGDNKIFLTTDASDWRCGAVLSYGPTWETARPVAFDSVQFKGAELNYAVHEKELLAIMYALKKWRHELVGHHFEIRTDHRTLKNFKSQPHLSRRQLRWSRDLADYDYTLIYIPGDSNTVADALSRLPADQSVDAPAPFVASVALALFNDEPPDCATDIAATLTVQTDPAFTRRIASGYAKDAWASKVLDNLSSVPTARTATTEHGRLLYIGARLVIPRIDTLRQDVFELAHDALGHFGLDKSYEVLRTSYFWPGMRADLANSYLPSCDACQRNNASTTKPVGPLHSLPVPGARGDSVAINFIGPLPASGPEAYNYLMTMTDRSGCDIRAVPCHKTLTAEGAAHLFFRHWYCENGLPLEIVSDRDARFDNQLWRAFHKLTGIKLLMSSSFHAQTDGASERTNKTLIYGAYLNRFFHTSCFVQKPVPARFAAFG
ncbi:unnamed protein product [Peniophora sp. CBMAI 1063]|nr:unnamed protein product [Peniophora sp. CBMAI 1063]